MYSCVYDDMQFHASFNLKSPKSRTALDTHIMKTNRTTKVALLLLLFAYTYANAQSNRRQVASSSITKEYKSAVKQTFYNELNSVISTGYHGLADFGYTIGFGDYKMGGFEFSTTHGYQFNPYIFIGAGLGVHFMSEYSTPYMNIPLDYRGSQVDIPIYVNLRLTILNGPISPFIDGKCGHYLTHHGGVYLNASVGCRFATWRKQSVNIYIGYSNENLEFETFDKFYSSHNMDYRRMKRNLSTDGLSIKLGYEY